MWFLEIAALPTEELAISQILQLEQHSPQVAEDIILRLASSHLEKGQLWYQAETGQLPRQGETTSKSKQVGRHLQDQVLGQLSGRQSPTSRPLASTACPLHPEEMKTILVFSGHQPYPLTPTELLPTLSALKIISLKH